MGKLEKLENGRHVFKGGFSTKNPRDLERMGEVVKSKLEEKGLKQKKNKGEKQ